MVRAHQSYQEKVSQMISWGHWFALFNILLILPLGSRYLFESDWPRTLLGRIYALISWLGHFSFITFAIYLLILFPLTFAVRSQRILRLISAVIATAGITLLLIDSEIFNQFRLHLNPTVFQLITNPDDAELSRNWQFLFISTPIIFLLEILFGTWCWQKQRSLSKRTHYAYPLVILLIISFFGSHFLHIWADANFYRPITMQKSNLPLSYPMTARSFLEKHGLLDLEEHRSKQDTEGNPAAFAIDYPQKPIVFAGPKAQYNVLMIVVDQLSYADIANNMPELNQFAQQNINYNQHMTTGDNINTSLVGLFYGIAPTYLDGILNERTPSVLMTSLSQQNYQIGLFSSNAFNSPIYRQSIFKDLSIADKAASYSKLTQQWLKWVAKASSEGSPWFSYISYADNKITTPSLLNEQSLVKTSDQTALSIHNDQLTTRNIDKHIADIVNWLKENQQLEETAIVITAHNGINSDSSGLALKGYSREQLHVPLIIHWPGKETKTISKLTSHVDIMTTIMQDILGVANHYTDYTQGENLFIAERHNNWVLSGKPNTIVITTPTQTIVLRENSNYSAYDKEGQQLDEKKPSLSLLLQVLTEIKRFIAK